MLPLERRQGTVHEHGCDARVYHIVLPGIARAVLSGLGKDRKRQNQYQEKDSASHHGFRM